LPFPLSLPPVELAVDGQIGTLSGIPSHFVRFQLKWSNWSSSLMWK